ncbi:efflux RND transporter periplasmic adaptor subunit [Parasediminibacterium sp. JCM 36343]|uniref:efflux RND transporter periplasmic adaptor subunit n=1 Tax=Parasediminibacterium sp. JCM 36343 TaxID=3374279 RepID=UPI0039798DAF
MKYISFLSLSLLLLAACGDDKSKTPPPPPPPTVSVYEVHQGSATYYDNYPATITALNQVDIRAQVSGAITGIYFTDGQQVTKGQKLYSIDEQLYSANLQQAGANLNVSKANLAKAQQDADRYNELAKHDAIAKQVLDHALADLQAQKMQLEAAKANYRSVETNVHYATIYAPFTGTIGISQVKLGTAVTAGSMVLNTVSTDDPIAVDFSVNEKEIYRFTQLEQKGSNPADSIFTLALPDGSIYPIPGKIALIDRAVDPQTGTIKTRLEFNNSKKYLRAGMSCNVRIKNNSNATQLLIPMKALLEQMGEYFVFVVGDSSKVVQKRITTGAIINDKIVVKDGLAENDKIVLDGVQKMKDGVKVKVVGKPTAAPAGTDSAKGK